MAWDSLVPACNHLEGKKVPCSGTARPEISNETGAASPSLVLSS